MIGDVVCAWSALSSQLVTLAVERIGSLLKQGDLLFLFVLVPRSVCLETIDVSSEAYVRR